jgi:hypothetical protein
MLRYLRFGFLYFLLVFFIFHSAFANENISNHEVLGASTAKTKQIVTNSETESLDTKNPEKIEAKKLYDLFNKSYFKTIAQIQCLKDLSCINSEDDVLKYSVYNVKLLQKLEALASKNNLWAMYYRGLISYERALDYADRASYIRDRDFIFTAMVLNRKRDEQFYEAKKFFIMPANAKLPEACQYMGNIYAQGFGFPPDKEKAMEFYYFAAKGFIDQSRLLEAQIVLNAMTETSISTDARTVEIYAKVHKNIR